MVTDRATPALPGFKKQLTCDEQDTSLEFPPSLSHFLSYTDTHLSEGENSEKITNSSKITFSC